MCYGMPHRDPVKRDVIQLIRADEIARNFKFELDVAEEVLEELAEKGEVAYLGDGLYELTKDGCKRLVQQLRGPAPSF